MGTIYSQRVSLNNWEVLGIEKYLTEQFELSDFIYSDDTIHVDIEEKRFGVYKISNGEDLYITLFLDDEANRTFRLNLATDDFCQLDEEFNFIAEVKNIFNI